jgi:CDP-2,3-bis-(O-geranylgeranyl)-sn-glycerol synthase
MDIFATILVIFWAFLPAYLPNSAAVLAGGQRPIDNGRKFRDKRILGDGKTWVGTLAGITAGAVLALILNYLNPVATQLTGLELPMFPLSIVLAFPAGAMLGDITASFVKRRLDRERGAPLPLVDQLDFLAGALVLGALVNFNWLSSSLGLELIAVAVVMTAVLHVTTNIIGYRLGFKNEPW